MSPLSAAALGGLQVVRAGARVARTGGLASITAARVASLRHSGARARDRARTLREAARRVLALHGLELDVAGHVEPGPAILACNHVSWLDPLVVASQVACAPISKLDVRGWPVFGKLAEGLGVIFHDRGDPASGLRVMREVERMLVGGRVPVLNFPEGTTSDGRSVLSFRKGLFGLALRLGVPVVPVALRYLPAELAWTGDATFVPHYLRWAAGRGSLVRVRLGAPLSPGAFADAASLAGAVRQRVVDLLETA